MSAVYKVIAESPSPASMSFSPIGVNDLDEVLLIEKDVYPYPWTRGNFLDSLYSGYEAWALREPSGTLTGYFLLMLAVDEAHLLNISVRRDLQGKGVGRMQLDKAVALAKEKGMSSILLEVRPSNQRALDVYHHYGFIRIGLRKAYYPAGNNMREDAIVMRFSL
ncbi:MAG TPA: ribosomal protein S18-alanine N-acetyltransferase [Noviherbaspirillum sp.]|jgi:ribosomal-protein-alanine N-acetyltransferase|nr:ribosomal protein S18-alanine N-acetyltransferase [Noviherbaspirillum sp.]